jgi:GDP-D-mannose 3', 5'-epimerase
MSRRVLVTGGAGMIGSNLVKRLVAEGYSVHVVDNLWRGKIEYLLDDKGNPAIDLSRNFYELDLSLPGVIEDIVYKFDYIYHLADVVAGIDYIFNNQGSVFRQNLLINSNVITSARKSRRLKGFIYVGTACSFPAIKQTGIDALPLKEEDQYPAAPESAYGWSKLMGEYEALLMEAETGIPVSILSLHNVYGPPADFDINRSQVIPSLIRKAIRYPNERFRVWGSGEQGRAFVHVRDVVEGLIYALDKSLGQGVIQIGPDTCTSIKNVSETIVKISGKEIEIEFDLNKPEGDRGRCADFSKARNILGWEPKVGLEEGLNELYDWIENRINVSQEKRFSREWRAVALDVEEAEDG